MATGFVQHVRKSIETMSPGYFSMVMATGILSLAAHLLGMSGLARALFALNVVLFAIIGVLAVARAGWHSSVRSTICSTTCRYPASLPSACSILGSQALLIGGSVRAAELLGIIRLLACVGLTYALFTVLTVKQHKP